MAYPLLIFFLLMYECMHLFMYLSMLLWILYVKCTTSNPCNPSDYNNNFFIYTIMCIVLQMNIYSLHFIAMFIDKTWRYTMSKSSQSIKHSKYHKYNKPCKWWIMIMKIECYKFCILECIFVKNDMLFNVDIFSQLDDNMSPVTVTIIYWNFEYCGPLWSSNLYNKGYVIHSYKMNSYSIALSTIIKYYIVD